MIYFELFVSLKAEIRQTIICCDTKNEIKVLCMERSAYYYRINWSKSFVMS